MPSLLCTLGSSWAVVPEAFLMGHGETRYAEVVVIATSGVQESVRHCRAWFAQYQPAIILRIYEIADLPDIRNAEDHARFEEALFRVYGGMYQVQKASQIHICLAGGFKTISSAAHQTADLFGCGKLFHITSPFGERFDDHESILRGIAEGKLSLVDLGPRPGWPTIQELLRDAPLLPEEDESFLVEDTAFREKILNRIGESHRLSQSEDELSILPFPQIARWSPSARDWLQEPVDGEKDRDWVKRLPKVELHCHLGGFATHGELLRQVRDATAFPEKLPALVEPQLRAHWPLPDQPIALTEYMDLGGANGSAILKDPGCLRKQCELLYQHLCEQNIRYAEIRCSPANYTSQGRSAWKVLEEIQATFDACMNAVAASTAVAASVPLDGIVPASILLADPHPRSFHPFLEEGDYRQTWRNLPHRLQKNAAVFLTFRLADSIPAGRLKQWHDEEAHFLSQHPKPWAEDVWRQYQRQFPQRLDRWLDEAHGVCLMAQAEVREIIETALHHFDGERYILDDYAIMPNHVHVIFKPLPGHTLEEITHSWKSFTAKKMNDLRGSSGQVWQHECFDHLIRSEKQLCKLRDYIADNPQKAGTPDATVGRGLGLVLDAGKQDACRDHAAKQDACSYTTHVNLIVIGTRKKEGDHRSAILQHLTLATTAAEHGQHSSGCRIVGVDLAGFEDKETRAHYYRDDFRIVHRAGLALTVHAGENDDSEGIWSAVFDLNTRRLGHALSLGESPSLLRSVADRKIVVEMCPYANYQIKGFFPMPGKPQYPLMDYLRSGVVVTINTDNIGISAASLTENILLAARMCPELSRLDVLHLLRHAIDGSFLSSADKQQLLRSMHIPSS